ncbi:MAG: hydroxyethylthiazole kinase [Acidaminococcus sp.]|jgi:hydroxyethylthiazole kinase|nr:hydroxyethylthiazole kinase [Acidaminococcus sp.]MCI2115382.1 hydroxyethylthiazole kinase [Acidaminococcus sp.]MCI2117478.1 hydroxyethylthiazole kinase [Acidaminococcus sp.]
MTTDTNLAARFAEIRAVIYKTHPLIHCLTHPITINDSANLVLAVGASPNMAPHPDEVEEAVKKARVLTVNLGNLTAERLTAMERGGRAASEAGIPLLLDATGAAFSTLRLHFSQHFIQDFCPCIVKGNASEIRALCGKTSHGVGVDVGAEDRIGEEDLARAAKTLLPFAEKWQTTILMTGKVDCIVGSEKIVFVHNGTPVLSRLTGTGCMLGALTGVYLAAAKPWEAAALAAVIMGLAGEKAAKIAYRPGLPPQQSWAMGTFHTALMDALSTLTDTDIQEGMKVTFLEK